MTSSRIYDVIIGVMTPHDVWIHFECKFGVYLLMLGELFYIYLVPTFSTSIRMNGSLLKKLCYNTAEAVLFVTESDDEDCDKILMRLMKSLVKLIPLLDGENDDLMESGGSEEESEDQANHGCAHGRPRFFLPRTQKWLVKDIGSGLDKSNYDLLPITSETEEIGFKLEKNKSITKKIFGTNWKPSLFGKQCRENVVSNRPGVKPEYWNYDTIDEAWSLFFDGIIKLIVTCTNPCILEKVASMNESSKESNKTTHLYHTSEQEMNTFIGLKLDSHVSENFCQIKIFLSLVRKNTIICLFGV